MNYIEELKEVIRHLHGADATHVESVPVTEIFKGQVVWDGVVEVFDLDGHPKAKRAYAWKHELNSPDSPHKYAGVAVLHIPPVVSPQTAVQAAIVQEYRNRES